jgi:flagellar motor switch/type III secretory pathway protein FliN
MSVEFTESENEADSPAEDLAESAGSALVVQADGGSAPGGLDPGRNAALAGLPLQLDVSIPIPEFRVQDLLTLKNGTVLASSWPYADDVPVYCGGVQLVWAEFEVVDDVLAVRVTRVL